MDTNPNGQPGTINVANAQKQSSFAINMNNAQAFGDKLNWGHIFGSNMLLAGAQAFAHQSPNSQQNAILSYNQQHFSPLNYESYTANNSTQALYGNTSPGIATYDEGGFASIEPDPEREMLDYMFDDTPIDATKAAEMYQPKNIQKPFEAEQQPDESGTLGALDYFTSMSQKNNMWDAERSNINTASSKVNLNGVHEDVMGAVEELQHKFPTLTVTSGMRSWGDKDAHPQGRAVDMSGPFVEEAYKYYKNTMVPKYGFNPALALNHGTGPHIHVGYYDDGGELGPGPINRGDTPSYYGIHSPVMASNIRHTDYGNPAPPAQQASQNAQSWMPIANQLNKLSGQHEIMYNMIYNAGKQEGWSQKKIDSEIQKATGGLQGQMDSLTKLLPTHYADGGLTEELHAAIGDEINNCPECVQEMMKTGGWIQKATAHMRKDHPCTGSKFGSSSCPPGSRRYNLAKTFRAMHHKHKEGGLTEQAMGGIQLQPGVMYSQGQVEASKISNFKKNKKQKYEQGGTYELTQSEIDNLKQLGYEFE